MVGQVLPLVAGGDRRAAVELLTSKAPAENDALATILDATEACRRVARRLIDVALAIRRRPQPSDE
jgi:hypothetical protein